MRLSLLALAVLGVFSLGNGREDVPGWETEYQRRKEAAE